MSGHDSQPSSVVVIGGGISGLAAAHRLVELAPKTKITLLEAGPRLGGVLQTERQDGYLLEAGADNFITNVPWALDLCHRLGLDDQLIPTDESRRRAMVVHNGRLHAVPEGFLLMAPSRLWPVLASPILSWRGKLRLLAEPLVRRCTSPEEESIADFATRRLGREVFERLVQPLVGGIYTGDAAQLSLAATLPRFLEMERQYGSLVRAARAERKGRRGSEVESSGARYGMFVTLRDGLQSLVAAIQQRLPSDAVELNTSVERIVRQDSGRWTIAIANQPPREADAVIVAVGTGAAARILLDVDAALSRDLSRIPYAGSAVALVGYRREQIRHQLDSFGFVVPDIAGRRLLAASFSSQKFPDRAPPGHVLIRVFCGGAARPELVMLPDNELRRIVLEELVELLGISGEPDLFTVERWPAAMPQYHLGHLALVERIERQTARQPGLALAGNAYRGLGLPQCIHSGEQAAQRVLAIR